MPSRKESLSSKRKTAAAQGPSKKAKTELASPEVKDASKVLRSPSKHVMNLHGIAPVLPDSVYVNPHIIPPFADVQDQGTFGLMARYFWCAFSANARYASEDLQNHLLELICMTHGKTWHKDAAYQHIWREQYAEVISDYYASIETITNRWLTSPAGRLFRETCAKSRKLSKALPMFEVSCMREYEGATGISWGIAEIEEFFAPLKEVAETAPLEFRTEIDPIGQADWFVADFDAILARSDDSWLRRLSAVVNSIMVQWIRVHCRFSQIGGSTVDPSRGSLELILERIPTEPTSEKNYPSFPVPDLPLDQWIRPDDKRQPAVTEEDFTATEITREHKVLAEGKGTISNQNLAKAVEIGEKVGQATTMVIQEATNLLPSNPIASSPKITPIFDSTVTPAKMYAPALDDAEFAFISGNTATKVQIASAYAKEELNGWVYWYDACGRQIQYWQRQIKDLKEAEKQLKESRENGLKLLKLLLDNKKQVEDTKSRIDDAKQHSSIAARQLERSMQSPKSTLIPPTNTQPLYAPLLSISDNSDTRSVSNFSAVLFESNSPVLCGVDDLLSSLVPDGTLLPPVDFVRSKDKDGNNEDDLDMDMKDGEVDESDETDSKNRIQDDEPDA